MPATHEPRTVLDPAKLYHDPTGRITCGSVHCVGMTAAYTGKNTGGGRVKLLTPILEWAYAEEGFFCRCESCHKTSGPAMELRSKDTNEPVQKLVVRCAYKKKGQKAIIVVYGEPRSYGDAGHSTMEFKSARSAALFMAAFPEARMPAWDRLHVVPVEEV